MTDHDHDREVAFYGECITCARTAAVPEPTPTPVDPHQVGGGKVGRLHPTSSVKAAGTVKVGSQLAHLLGIVTESRDGITAADAAELLSERVGHTVSRNQTATRMGELGERGLVTRNQLGATDGGRPVYETRPTDDQGNEGAVWRAVDRPGT